MSGAVSAKLVHHTLVAAVIFLTMILAPVLLFLRQALGIVAVGFGLAFLAIGCASLIGAHLSRYSNDCAPLQWRFLIFSVWLLNPVFVAILGVVQGEHFGSSENYALAWWSGLPLAAAIAIFSGRLRLGPQDRRWSQETCPFPPTVCFHWLFSRTLFVMLPMCLFSFQICMYLPEQKMEPPGLEVGVGFFLCGSCVLISLKICALCRCLRFGASRFRNSQSFCTRHTQPIVLVLFLCADWICSLHLMDIVDDDYKPDLLLMCLLAAGIFQLQAALARLHLGRRWKRARERLRQQGAAREISGAARASNAVDLASRSGAADAELGTPIHQGGSPDDAGAGGASIESTDSEDEREPGSIPAGFHEALLCILGVSFSQPNRARRENILGVRRAVVAPPRRPASTETSGGGAAALLADTHPQPAPISAGGSNGMEDTCSAAGHNPPGRIRSETSTTVAATGESVVASGSVSVQALGVSHDYICTICCDHILTDQMVRPLPRCTHVFHAECLERWVKEKREDTTCPVCRKPGLTRKKLSGSQSFHSLAGINDSTSSSSRTPRSRGSSTLRQQGSVGAGGQHQIWQQRPHQQSLRGSLGLGATAMRPQRIVDLQQIWNLSSTIAEAALDCADGDLQAAAHLITEYKGLLQADFQESSRGFARLRQVEPPSGVVQAFVEAYPDLAGLEGQLGRHLSALYTSGRLSARASWAELLRTDGQLGFFRTVMEDARRRLDEREPRRRRTSRR